MVSWLCSNASEIRSDSEKGHVPLKVDKQYEPITVDIGRYIVDIARMLFRFYAVCYSYLLLISSFRMHGELVKRNQAVYNSFKFPLF